MYDCHMAWGDKIKGATLEKSKDAREIDPSHYSTTIDVPLENDEKLTKADFIRRVAEGTVQWASCINMRSGIISVAVTEHSMYDTQYRARTIVRRL